MTRALSHAGRRRSRERSDQKPRSPVEPKQKGVRKEFSPGASRGRTDLLTPWFQSSDLQNCWRRCFCCFGLQDCGHLLQQLREMYTVAKPGFKPKAAWPCCVTWDRLFPFQRLHFLSYQRGLQQELSEVMCLCEVPDTPCRREPSTITQRELMDWGRHRKKWTSGGHEAGVQKTWRLSFLSSVTLVNLSYLSEPEFLHH